MGPPDEELSNILPNLTERKRDLLEARFLGQPPSLDGQPPVSLAIELNVPSIQRLALHEIHMCLIWTVIPFYVWHLHVTHLSERSVVRVHAIFDASRVAILRRG